MVDVAKLPRELLGTMHRALIIAAIVAAPSLCALALDPNKAITQYVHEVWTTESGLPQNSVTSILQTRDGYLWFGTQEGLVRFDGIRFTVFNSERAGISLGSSILVLLEGHDGDLYVGTRGAGLVSYRDGVFRALTTQQGLSNNIVQGLFMASSGTLWIITESGLNSLEDGRITAYTTLNGLPSNKVRAVIEDTDKSMWVGTEEGLCRLRTGALAVFTTRDGLLSNSVRAIHPTGDGDLWIVTDGGINRWHGGHFSVMFKEPLQQKHIRTALWDSSDVLWLGTQNGLLRFAGGKLTSYSTSEGLSNNDVWVLFNDKDQNLWIGTLGGGINRIRNGKITHLGSPQGFVGDQVNAFCEDSEGNLWIGTLDGGLHRLGDGKFTVVGQAEGLSHNLVWSICEDRQGAVWLGTDNGLNRYFDGTIRSYFKKDGLGGNIIQTLCEDGDGGLWIGTWGGGVSLMREGRFAPFPHQDDMAMDYVCAIHQDRAGVMWFGTSEGGLKRLKGGRLTVFTTKEGLSHNKVRMIHEDRHGNLWIGTDGGLDLFKDDKFVHYTMKEGLPSNLVYAMYEDAQDNSWIGTANGGLSLFRDGHFTNFTSKDGLFGGGVFTIQEDGNGNLWMTSNRGLFRVSKRELMEFASKTRKPLDCVSYGRPDGMRSFECNGSSQPVSCRTRDGNLWFATTKGAVILEPGPIRSNGVPPSVAIEEVLVDGRPMGGPGVVAVPPGSRNLQVHYTALSFMGSEKVRFRCQLDGFDPGWQDAGTQRVAYYTKLPPGRYIFRVTACNNDGVWNQRGASLTLEQKPYFYQTLWFLGLCALAALLSVFGIYGQRVRGLKARQEVLQRLVDERTGKLAEANMILEDQGQKLQQANQVLERLSILDGLTGIANRRHFDEVLGFEWRRACRESLSLALVMIDIDHFKAYNDAHGHQAGDECLRKVASTLAGSLSRAGDLAARYGGEEFAVLLAGTDSKSATDIAEILRVKVQALGISHEHSSAASVLTLSLGIAALCPTQDVTPETLVGEADQALYKAKQAGRNRVVTASSATELDS